LNALGHGKRLEDKSAKGKLCPARACLPPSRLDAKMASMSRFVLCRFSFLLALMIPASAPAQAPDKNTVLLETLSKKIDEQNAKIDALSQQILKLEQQVSAIKPGVMIGENPTPAPAPAATTATTETPKPQSGNSHVVAKGETLTSIAKMHKVSVEELQKFNHIENDRKLQIGQTIMIPTPSTAPSVTPNG
jgi:LysM repeat protein